VFRHAPLKFLGRSIANRNCIGRAFQTRLARRVFDSAILVLFPTLRVDKIDDRFANNQKMHLRVSWLGNVARCGWRFVPPGQNSIWTAACSLPWTNGSGNNFSGTPKLQYSICLYSGDANSIQTTLRNVRIDGCHGLANVWTALKSSCWLPF